MARRQNAFGAAAADDGIDGRAMGDIKKTTAFDGRAQRGAVEVGCSVSTAVDRRVERDAAESKLDPVAPNRSGSCCPSGPDVFHAISIDDRRAGEAAGGEVVLAAGVDDGAAGDAALDGLGGVVVDY